MALTFDCVSSLFVRGGCWDDEVGASSFLGKNAERLHQADLAFLPDFPVEDDESIAFLMQKDYDHLPREDYLERYWNRVLDVTARQDAISCILKWLFRQLYGAEEEQ